MRKLLAGSLSAAMLLCSATAVFAEAEPETQAAEVAEVPAPQEVTFKMDLTAQGQTLAGEAKMLIDSEQDAGLSASLTVPGGEGAEPVVIGAEDVVRGVGGDLYLNVDAIRDIYQAVTGDTSISSILAMVGITESWVDVPPINLVFDEEAISGILESLEGLTFDTLMADIEGIVEPITVQETETSWIIPVNKDIIIAVADKVDALLANNGETFGKILSLLNPSTLYGAIDYKTSFADYINAYVEGRVSVTGEDPAAATEETYALIDSAIDQMVSQFSSQVPLDQIGAITSSIPDLSDALAASLQEFTIDGQIEVAKDFSVADGAVTVAQGENQADFTLHAATTETGLTAEVLGVNKADGQTISANLDSSFDGTTLSSVCSVKMNDAEMLNASLNAAVNEDGSISGEYVMTSAEGENAKCAFKITQGENDVLCEAEFYAADELLASANASVSSGEEVMSMFANVTVPAQSLNVGISGSIPFTMDSFSFAASATQYDAEIFDFSCEGSIAEAPADTDITAPESSTVVYDIVKNVSALYYSMQAAQAETETGAAE